jgi:hypothetical protein
LWLKGEETMADKTTKATPTHLSGDAVEEISSNLRRLLAGRVRPLSEDEEYSLAHKRASLSRLPFGNRDNVLKLPKGNGVRTEIHDSWKLS